MRPGSPANRRSSLVCCGYRRYGQLQLEYL